MKLKTALIFSLFIFFIHLTKKVSEATKETNTEREPSVECVEDLNDFALNGWSASPQWEYEYTSETLPGILKNKFEGEGIWWMEGGRSLAIVKYFFSNEFTRPMFLYVKYYNHIQENGTERAYGHPALYPDTAILQYTSNYVWGEQVIELDVDQLEEGYRAGVSATKFDVDEYFLVERMIISQGYNLKSNDQINDIKSLCGWDEPIEETTTNEPDDTTTVPPEDTTTTKKPQPGFCQADGSFADPDDCTIFHVCHYDPNTGEFIDEILTCPETTVWCQRTLQCETLEICPCNLRKF